MLLVDCPLCDLPAPFDAVEDTLDCDACGVVLEIATTDPLSLLCGRLTRHRRFLSLATGVRRDTDRAEPVRPMRRRHGRLNC